MKKRHEQKLVILSITLFVMINIPFVLVFDVPGTIAGIPILYFALFSIWLIAIIISFIILKRHYE
ncbi:MAG: hypothetical protein CML02_07420 [Pseudooceanicola sp.]|nr:hypothetical protein [Pseudooceanicola sp.]|tara:strand:- start:1313 stop:1507 length:195 start_codon:yes stop_codon:yes gene_type:complete